MSKWNDRSPLTVTRQGIGVPGLMCAVLALNSYSGQRRISIDLDHGITAPLKAQMLGREWWVLLIGAKESLTLQKSIDLTPLLPSAGPTGGLGLACPAPTMSFTTWSAMVAPRFDMMAVVRTAVVVEERGGLVRQEYAPQVASLNQMLNVRRWKI